jgi:hypothetical protein
MFLHGRRAGVLSDLLMAADWLRCAECSWLPHDSADNERREHRGDVKALFHAWLNGDRSFAILTFAATAETLQHARMVSQPMFDLFQFQERCDFG